ncbi:vacuolar protein sorting-associated protein 16 homolog, partial [Clonorchis sinensis]
RGHVTVLISFLQNLQLRLNAMQRAEETYKQLKNDFMSQECNAAIRLLRFQSKLEKQELKAPVFEFANSLNDDPYSAHLILPVVAPTSVEETSWVGQPLNTTLARLLAIPHGERHADQLRREFRVSEKRFAHLRLIGLALQGDCWSEIEKMSKAKRLPINLETLIKVCVDCNHFEEAQSLVPRLPVERRVRFWLMCGQIEQAIQAAVREKSDSDLRLIQEHVGKGNDAMYSRIAALRQQIRV